MQAPSPPPGTADPSRRLVHRLVIRSGNQRAASGLARLHLDKRSKRRPAKPPCRSPRLASKLPMPIPMPPQSSLCGLTST
ncbi:hypothetical protein B0T26DRAFT_469971 [Lasiosphaeria miniovina]|uniref:Uncharacterized protein n=1 Tax=Lasiosphaeria miniovina TaxID=1954250 RepID=A0AA39ZZZ1_9PEZI|nr:uncharacterized protein B0T26DRAFT_469971 [Lasiosphaeria miniovina]KAK0706737.1 hypothetical protein B0T26DRAFT_469971 [Lasiosphaeria miniovina]